MPKSAFLRDLFIKHFAAKAFGWSPEQTEQVDAEALDYLLLIESEINKRDKEKHNG